MNLSVVSEWFTVSRVGWMLMHSVWQGSVIALGLAMTLGVLRNRAANTRYACACAAMLLCVLTPVLTVIFTHPASQVVSMRADATLVLPDGAAAIASGDETPVVQIRLPEELSYLQKLERFIPYTVYLWSAGVVALCLRMSIGFGRVQAWKGNGYRIIDERWTLALSRCGRSLALSRSILLLQSQRVTVPMTIGFFKPVVLIPASLASGLTPLQIQGILAHELAHIRRHDYLVNLIQTAIETLLFFHPAVRWMGQVIRQERENCCDDLAADIVGSPRGYAETLVRVEELCRQGPRVSLAMTGGVLLPRIQRLLGRPSARMFFNGQLAAAMTVLIGLLVVGCIAHRSSAAAEVENDASQGLLPEDRKTIELPDTLGAADILVAVVSTRDGKTSVSSHRVSADGAIHLSDGTTLAVAGRTPSEVEGAYLRQLNASHPGSAAKVEIEVAELRSRSFVLRGGKTPGSYPILKSDFRVIDALALAGLDVRTVDAVIIDRAQPNSHRITVPIDDATAGKANIQIRPGDVVTVAVHREEHTLQPGERISLMVLGSSGKQGTVELKLSRTGKITVDRIGEVHAAGLTTSQLETEVENRYRVMGDEVTAQAMLVAVGAPPSPPKAPSMPKPPVSPDMKVAAGVAAIERSRATLEDELAALTLEQEAFAARQSLSAADQKSLALLQERIARSSRELEAMTKARAEMEVQLNAARELDAVTRQLKTEIDRLEKQVEERSLKEADASPATLELRAQIEELATQLAQVRLQREAMKKAGILERRPLELSRAATQPATAPSEPAARTYERDARGGVFRTGVYYVSGVPRSGAYSWGDARPITLSQAIISAGGAEPTRFVIRRHRIANNQEKTEVYRIGDLLDGKIKDPRVQVDDLLMVVDRAPSLPATQPVEPQVGYFYDVEGEGVRSGKYSIDRQMGTTVLRALAMAGVNPATSETLHVKISNRDDVLLDSSVRALLEGSTSDIFLRGGEKVMIEGAAPSTNPATQQSR